jgi:hypothetical protein
MQQEVNALASTNESRSATVILVAHWFEEFRERR